MPKTGSNIYKRKDGRWEGRYLKSRDDKGKIVYGYIYAKSCGELKKLLQNLSQDVVKSRSQAGSISETAEQWLSAMTLTVKPSTLAAYEAMVRLHILPLIGDKDIGKLTSATINEFTQTMLQHGRVDGNGGLAPKTVRDILSVLKGIVDFAFSEKSIENPISITYPRNQQKQMRVLSRSEQSALNDVLLEQTTIYELGILLCMYTGLRIGEVCGLRWQDFSTGFDKLSVRRSMRRIKNKSGDGCGKTKIIIDTPKSKSSLRDIPVPKFLSSVLRSFMREKGTYFLSTSERLMTEPRIMQYCFKRVIKATGISDANFHSLRHTFSTRCIEAGVDIKSLSEMLGHASVNITLNRYVHSSFEQKRGGINKLEQYLGL